MKPIVICRYAPHEGPGYFATYLDRHRLPWKLAKLDEGEPPPAIADVSAIAMMGGPMSVNDDLPWIEPMLNVVREAVDRDVPVIGHCLGGQLLARALGGKVTSNSVKEIGWGRVEIADDSAAEWGTSAGFLSFHWHGETFSIPPGATRIWSSTHCANQAFVVNDTHLGMQCHVEMTPEMIDAWCQTGAAEIEESVGRSPAVQTPQAMREHVEAKVAELNAIANRVYDRWTNCLRAQVADR